jgi:hypothetical protein
MSTKQSTKDGLDRVIANLLERLADLDPANDDEYPVLLDRLTKLTKLREYDRKPVSRDTMLLVAGNLAGILLIIGYERVNVITTRAIGFVGKFR